MMLMSLTEPILENYYVKHVSDLYNISESHKCSPEESMALLSMVRPNDKPTEEDKTAFLELLTADPEQDLEADTLRSLLMRAARLGGTLPEEEEVFTVQGFDVTNYYVQHCKEVYDLCESNGCTIGTAILELAKVHPNDDPTEEEKSYFIDLVDGDTDKFGNPKMTLKDLVSQFVGNDA